MQALLSIYAWTIAASTILGSALALLGVQLAARDRAMQTMCIGQGAMLGVLVGIGFFLGFEATPTQSRSEEHTSELQSRDSPRMPSSA